MDRLRELEVVVAVAEAGSFAGAATRLRLSPPAVSRAVSALEDRLGTRVFQRTTRSLAITDVGRRLVEGARRVLAELEAAEAEAAGGSATPRGHLTITAPVTFGRAVLAPVICDVLAGHPGLTASVVLLDRVVHLVEEGMDVAVRIGQLPDSSLVARRLGEVRRVLVASPAYLEREGAPRMPADLRNHATIAFTGLMPLREWRFGPEGRSQSVALKPALEINDAAAAIEAAERGHGITIALSYMVSDRVRAGTLTTVLDQSMSPPVPVHIVHPQGRPVASKVRAFVDTAAPRLKLALDRLTLDASMP